MRVCLVCLLLLARMVRVLASSPRGYRHQPGLSTSFLCSDYLTLKEGMSVATFTTVWMGVLPRGESSSSSPPSSSVCRKLSSMLLLHIALGGQTAETRTRKTTMNVAQTLNLQLAICNTSCQGSLERGWDVSPFAMLYFAAYESMFDSSPCRMTLILYHTFHFNFTSLYTSMPYHTL